MRAAVVHAFDQPPRLATFDEPIAGPGEVLVTVDAVALSQLVRAQASGKHYSGRTPPFVPGVNGVGRLADGQRVYFAFPRAPFGAMAERTVVAAASTTPVPDSLDTVTAAAMANPGMSSWAALTVRTVMQPGEAVLVIGANGASGRLAIQIAKHLGAGRVIAAARARDSEATLRALGADSFLLLGDDRGELERSFRDAITGGVDIVLDYVWGGAAEAFLAAATGHGEAAAAPRIRFVNMGSLGGPSISLPAAAIRSSGVELMGSGLGSVSHAGLVTAIAGVFGAASAAGLRIATQPVPIERLETAWAPAGPARTVFTFA